MTTTNSTADRAMPPMSIPRRIQAATRLAWKTLRTGQHLEVEAYFDGTSDGMDTMLSTMRYSLAQRVAAAHEAGA